VYDFAVTRESDMLDLCERFFAAAAAGDVEAMREMYAPEAVIWNNHTMVTQNVEQNLQMLAAVVRHIRGFRYEDVNRQVTASGFVEEHVLRGETPDGAQLSVPACVVCEVVDGRITRFSEYLNSAHLEPLTRPAPK
jgi:ketosteroid isomerase-like protein